MHRHYWRAFDIHGHLCVFFISLWNFTLYECNVDFLCLRLNFYKPMTSLND